MSPTTTSCVRVNETIINTIYLIHTSSPSPFNNFHRTRSKGDASPSTGGERKDWVASGWVNWGSKVGNHWPFRGCYDYAILQNLIASFLVEHQRLQFIIWAMLEIIQRLTRTCLEKRGGGRKRLDVLYFVQFDKAVVKRVWCIGEIVNGVEKVPGKNPQRDLNHDCWIK